MSVFSMFVQEATCLNEDRETSQKRNQNHLRKIHMEFKTMNEGKKMRSQFFEVIQIRYLQEISPI